MFTRICVIFTATKSTFSDIFKFLKFTVNISMYVSDILVIYHVVKYVFGNTNKRETLKNSEVCRVCIYISGCLGVWVSGHIGI